MSRPALKLPHNSVRITIDAEALATALQRARKAAGLSLDRLSRHVGISSAALSRIEQGQLPTAEHLMILLMWAGFPLSTFLRHDGQPTDLPTEAPAAHVLHEAIAADPELSTESRAILLDVLAILRRYSARQAEGEHE